MNRFPQLIADGARRRFLDPITQVDLHRYMRTLRISKYRYLSNIGSAALPRIKYTATKAEILKEFILNGNRI